VSHILDGGRIISHSAIEDALLRLSDRDGADLFASPADDRARNVAFVEPRRVHWPKRPEQRLIAI
jgi:hypothetical protein